MSPAGDRQSCSGKSPDPDPDPSQVRLNDDLCWEKKQYSLD